MKTDDKTQTGIVIECFYHDASHLVLVVRSQAAKHYFFFYIPIIPAVDFGDKIQMNFVEDKYYICRGNTNLTYKIAPQPFPGTLLMELISERLNQ